MWILLAQLAWAGPDIYGFGSGNDGTLIEITDREQGAFAPLIAEAKAGDQTLTIGADAFNEGQLVVIHQIQGPDTEPKGRLESSALALDGEGLWELARITATGPSTLTLDAPLLHDFPPGDTQIVRVYEYSELEIGGTFRPPPYNGTVGGMLVIFVQDTLTIAGDISASGRGFRGALADNNSPQTSDCTLPEDPNSARRGEGLLSNRAESRGHARQGTAGGGGACDRAGGGGGALIGSGGGGGKPCCTAFPAETGGRGGDPVDLSGVTSPERPHVLLLGGGGGAGEHAVPFDAGSGGAGGGIIWLRAKKIVGGTVASNGEAGEDADRSGAGGGGAGGTIVIEAEEMDDTVLQAKGGDGGSERAPDNVAQAPFGPGGGGGGGLIQVVSSGTYFTNIAGGIPGTTTTDVTPIPYDATEGDFGSTVLFEESFVPSDPVVVATSPPDVPTPQSAPGLWICANGAAPPSTWPVLGCLLVALRTRNRGQR